MKYARDSAMLHDKRLGACCSVLAIAIAQTGAPGANGQWFVAFHLAVRPKEAETEREREKEKLKTVSNWKITNKLTKKNWGSLWAIPMEKALEPAIVIAIAITNGVVE